ncbi:MAG: TolB family protein, partial [Blastocatellia bacterium]
MIRLAVSGTMAMLLLLGGGRWLTESAASPDPAEAAQSQSGAPSGQLRDPREKRLANIRQLTFEGENAEAYFSPDGKKLVFQRTSQSDGCDQIFTMNLDGSDVRRISNGQGKTTCAYFTPDKRSIVYATTSLDDPKCPPKPDYSLGYVWSLFPGFEIVRANL